MLSVLIVNYNGADFITPCIDSVFASKTSFPFEIIVVDNASKDHSRTVLDAFGDRIKVLYSSKNLGFSEGNNKAAEIASGDMYFLLNNDTVVEENTLEILYQFLKNNTQVGAVAPKLIGSDGNLQAPGGPLGRWRFFSDTPKQVPFIAGAAVMMSKHVYEAIGGLDGNLFFYNDDIDMCMMLKKKGFGIYYVPTAQLIHYGGLSTKTRKLGSLIEGYRGGMYIAYKHYPRFLYHLYRLVLLLDVIPRLVVHSLRGCFDATQKQFAKAYIDVLIINWRGDIFAKQKIFD